MRCIFGGFLAIYGIYKPYDSDRNSKYDCNQMPNLAKEMLTWFENLESLRTYLGGSRLQEKEEGYGDIDYYKQIIGGNRPSIGIGIFFMIYCIPEKMYRTRFTRTFLTSKFTKIKS